MAVSSRCFNVKVFLKNYIDSCIGFRTIGFNRLHDRLIEVDFLNSVKGEQVYSMRNAILSRGG
jgi:hypothetical protein